MQIWANPSRLLENFMQITHHIRKMGGHMKKHPIDLRKYTRVFFGIRGHVDGTVAVEADRQVPVRFINLSEGGINFICDRANARHFATGMVVALNPKRTCMLSFLDNAECDVRYMLTVECIPLATIGCRFMKLPDTALDKIRKIVASRLGEKDDDSGAGPG